MTWLARLSLANRAVVGLVTALLLVGGLVATGSLRQEVLPSFTVPTVTVVTPYPGASPEVVAEQVTGPVETAVAGLAGVTGTTSSSTDGSSVVTLNLEYGTDTDATTTQVERAVQGARLPDDVTAKVGTLDTDSIPVVQLAASSNLPLDQLSKALRDKVQPLLSGITGVGEVTLSGIRDPRITIDVDTTKAARKGVSLSAVQTLLKANGVRVPAGQLTPDTSPLTVQVGSLITSVSDVENLFLAPGTGVARPVRLGDIATVTAERAPATGYTRTDGVESIGISVTKTGDANTVAVSKAVRSALPRVVDALGGSAQDAKVGVVFDQAPFIEQSISDLTTEGLLGLLFAVLVILAFLLSVRATLVTAVSIPLSLLIALIVLHAGGYTLNILTLAALTVAVGRVVDDSIVVIENIKRHLGMGGPPRAAILRAIGEVAGAITASTVTTVAVFAPIGLVSGQIGELFRPFAVAVAASLLASLVVSLTVVPVLASLVLVASGRGGAAASAHARPEPEERVTALQRGYLPVLRGALARPVLAVAVAVALLAGTLALVPLLQTSFLGSAGASTLTVSQELAPGTALPEADAAARKVEAVLQGTPGVEIYQATVGTTGPGLFGPSGGSGGVAPTQFSLTLTDDADAATVAADLRSRFTTLGAAAGTLTVAEGRDAGSNAVAVGIRADDPAVLAQAADLVQQAVARVPDVSDVQNNLAAAQPVVDVTVDREKAAEQGLTEVQVGQSVATALSGSTVGTLTIDGVEQSVVLRTGAAPDDFAALQDLTITGLRGEVALSDVATVARTTTAPSIQHTDGARSAQVTARPDDGADLGAVTTTLRDTLAGLRLPAGATVSIGGVSSDQADAFGQLGLALLAAIAVVYLVMVVTFKSLVQPLVLLVSIPFAATGALGLLLVTGTSLGVAALIGMLMLVGIVVTNAIVLIDLVNQYRSGGRPLVEAIVEGASQRLRPILMTAIATIFALLPMGLGLTGGGAFISQPLAVVVIGGLVSSTVLTLVLVPVLYLLAERRREGLGSDAGVDPGDDEPAAVADPPTAPVPVVRRTPRPSSRPSPRPAPDTAEVLGRVRTSDGAGVPATLRLVDPDGRTVATVRASEDGIFDFPRVQAGDHYLVVMPPVGESTTYGLTVPRSGTLRCDVTLPPARQPAHAPR